MVVNKREDLTPHTLHTYICVFVDLSIYTAGLLNVYQINPHVGRVGVLQWFEREAATAVCQWHGTHISYDDDDDDDDHTLLIRRKSTW